MRLKDCTLGILVINEEKNLGHIVGLTYNCSIGTLLKISESRTQEDLFSRTIPLVKWVDGSESGIHPKNINIFKG